MKRFILFYLSVASILVTTAISHAEPVDRLIQLIDYVGVDYQKAVVDGRIVSTTEYAEMVEFATTIEQLTGQLPQSSSMASLQDQVNQLKNLIEGKAPADQVAALASIMRTTLIKSHDLTVAPDKMPNLARGKALYAANCAACHGLNGDGKGSLSGALEPKPTNFLDTGRYEKRSLYGLFNTITYGVEGTAMADFSSLTNAERWDLTAYVGQLGARDDAAQRGETVWQQLKDSQKAISTDLFTTLTPAEAALKWENGTDLMAYLRQSPEVLFARDTSPIVFAQSMIRESYQAYQNGKKGQAYEKALSAYLDGFELVEASLAAIDTPLLKETERAMAQYRNFMQKKAAPTVITAQYQKLLPLLDQAQQRLSEKNSLTPTAAFVASLVILLREGLEALLVIIALSAFLMKTDRRDAMPYLHFGWISALVLGGATWLVSERLLQINGATREVTEGVAALTASAVLLFVSYWLHNKTSAEGWQKFIQGSVESALKGSKLWGLAGLSFITVYREVFETILFYQALWVQTEGNSADAVIEGFLAATLILMVIAWGAIKYSVRLPLRQFFAATGALLLILAFIFAGKGIAALQEAGKIAQTLTSFPTIEWLGIFPSKEGLVLQAAVLLIALLVYLKGRKAAPLKG